MPRKGASNRQSDFFKVCDQCRNELSCCFGPRPPITRKRRRIIEAYLKNERIAIADPFAETEYVFPRENQEGYCVFYDVKTAKCRIHPVKPETCVAGPITFDVNKKTLKIEYYIKKEKICRLAGIVHEDPKLLQRHLESAKREISKLVEALSPRELEAILKKEEPDTFRIDEDHIKRDGGA
jgi:Fe-S-cluster containining protein